GRYCRGWCCPTIPASERTRTRHRRRRDINAKSPVTLRWRCCRLGHRVTQSRDRQAAAELRNLVREAACKIALEEINPATPPNGGQSGRKIGLDEVVTLLQGRAIAGKNATRFVVQRRTARGEVARECLRHRRTQACELFAG